MGALTRTRTRTLTLTLTLTLTYTQDALEDFVNSKEYESFVMIVVFVNTIVLSIDHYPIESRFSDTLDAINFLLTLIFCLDMTLKFVGGWVCFFTSIAFT